MKLSECPVFVSFTSQRITDVWILRFFFLGKVYLMQLNIIYVLVGSKSIKLTHFLPSGCAFAQPWGGDRAHCPPFHYHPLWPSSSHCGPSIQVWVKPHQKRLARPPRSHHFPAIQDKVNLIKWPPSPYPLLLLVLMLPKQPSLTALVPWIEKSMVWTGFYLGALMEYIL